MKALAVSMAVVLTLAPQLAAADWSRVAGIRAGDNIRVETASGKQNGRLVAATDDELRLTPASGTEVAVRRSDVRRVFVQSRSNRVRNTIIGAAVGVGIGAVLYGTLGTLFRNEGDEQTGYMLAVPIAVGTAVGAAMPTGKMKKVYDSKDQ